MSEHTREEIARLIKKAAEVSVQEGKFPDLATALKKALDVPAVWETYNTAPAGAPAEAAPEPEETLAHAVHAALRREAARRQWSRPFPPPPVEVIVGELISDRGEGARLYKLSTLPEGKLPVSVAKSKVRKSASGWVGDALRILDSWSR